MRSGAWLYLAGVAAAATALVVAYIVVPPDRWNDASILAAILAAGAIALLFFVPRIGGRSAGGDAATFASLGPSSILSMLMLPWTIGTFFVALSGNTTIAWAMNAITVGGFITLWSLLQAAIGVVNSVSQATKGPSSHSTWGAEIRKIGATSEDVQIKAQLLALSDNLQYASRDALDRQIEENLRIADQIRLLSTNVASANVDATASTVRAIQALLEQREQTLKRLRSHN